MAKCGRACENIKYTRKSAPIVCRSHCILVNFMRLNRKQINERSEVDSRRAILAFLAYMLSLYEAH